LRLRIFKVIERAGNKKKHNIRYRKLNEKNTQNNCEKKEKISNCGIAQKIKINVYYTFVCVIIFKKTHFL